MAGKLYFCNPTIDDREAECARLQRETGAAFVHPYNDVRVMAGDHGGGLGCVFSFCTFWLFGNECMDMIRYHMGINIFNFKFKNMYLIIYN